MMRKVTSETTTREKIDIYCDFCEHHAIGICRFCKKDICGNHIKYDNLPMSCENTLTLGSFVVNCYCKTCWELGKSIRDKIILSERNHRIEIQSYLDEWEKLGKELC